MRLYLLAALTLLTTSLISVGGYRAATKATPCCAIVDCCAACGDCCTAGTCCDVDPGCCTDGVCDAATPAASCCEAPSKSCCVK